MRNLLIENNFWGGVIPTQRAQGDARDQSQNASQEITISDPTFPQENTIGNPLLPQNMSRNILREIPFLDPSYAGIDGRLIATNSSNGVRLCRYKTFQGISALQPCIQTEQQSQMFDALKEWEAPGQYIYKEARLWACVVQAEPGLPTECRWVAATVYNFANEMLRPDNTPEYLQTMLAWLVHWYGVAEILFGELGLALDTPNTDWFPRNSDTGAGSHDYSSSSDETVVHHVLSPEAHVFIRGSVLHPTDRPITIDLQDSQVISSSELLFSS
ncbi:hypothetical protein PWT90_06226 [Aphanocladium album]|nr:hypothetical protein PWT90_06226 [Aphanocladium album]